MIDKCVSSIINVQLRIGTIQDEQVEIYRYGYTLLIEVLINVVLSLTVSILLRKVREYIVFMFLFIPLRSFCGGYHAKKAWKCIVVSNAAIIAAVLFGDYIVRYGVSIMWYLALDIILGIIIMSFSPIESLNNRLNDLQKQKYKRNSQIIMTVEILLAVFCILINYYDVFYVVLSTHMIQAISLLAELLVNYKGVE